MALIKDYLKDLKNATKDIIKTEKGSTENTEEELESEKIIQ